jgi:hypothetical protein
MDKKLKNYIISILRRASYKSKFSGRSQALANARVGVNQYKCEMCSDFVTYPRKEVHVDHKEPVVPLEGFTNFDDFIDRLFCGPEGLQVLCKRHHTEKSTAENQKRREYKKILTTVEKIVKIDITDDMYIQYLIDIYGIENVLDYLEDKEWKGF